MSKSSWRSVIGLVAGAAAVAAVSVPASALNLDPDPIHLEGCRTVELARDVAHDVEFSSNATGPRHLDVHVAADGWLTLCWSLDATVASMVDVEAWTDATVDAVLGSILGESDASVVCSAVRLQVAPGVSGTVSATAHAYGAVDGAPPATWDYAFADDVEVSNLGEDVVFKSCFDTDGNTSVS